MTLGRINPFTLKVGQTIRFEHELVELADEMRGPFTVYCAMGEDHERGSRLLKKANRLFHFSPQGHQLDSKPLPIRFKVILMAKESPQPL